eukprot:TRINITY_DN921_c0_g1_i2.p1 TRINITY_DN921_c0_g1~~TRINITY_DN921_c0_g1_i2.p1  ORF type:complete len:249 (-),score=71.52 TRINITY_DN921_c0_g1_i2:130-876(-)
MTSMSTGYDLSTTTYSPDGRVFQVEYASKAVENSGTAIGIKVKDGIVFGVEKIILSKMLVEGSNKRIASIDRHVGFAFAGLMADARQLVNKAREEARSYKNMYDEPVPARTLNERMSQYMQQHTLYGSVRPFGCSILLGVYDKKGPHLYMIEPSGVSYGYFGVAIGKARQAAKTEIEKLNLSNLTAREALVEVARIIHSVHDPIKDKDFELELSWLCEESGRKHQVVPKDLLVDAEERAKAIIEAQEQ